jgi:rhodanese-related sulfurtransferase
MKQSPLVIVCKTDKRSAKAAELLREAGFKQLSVLRGGMVGWNHERFPVVRSKRLELAKR